VTTLLPRIVSEPTHTPSRRVLSRSQRQHSSIHPRPQSDNTWSQSVGQSATSKTGRRPSVQPSTRQSGVIEICIMFHTLKCEERSDPLKHTLTHSLDGANDRREQIEKCKQTISAQSTAAVYAIQSVSAQLKKATNGMDYGME